MITELKHMEYEERLEACHLTKLEERRKRGDMIQTFHIIKGIDNIDYRKFFEVRQDSITRGHSLKLVKPRASSEMRRNFYSHRIVNDWNMLPDAAVQAETVLQFKKEYEFYTNTKDHKGHHISRKASLPSAAATQR